MTPVVRCSMIKYAFSRSKPLLDPYLSFNITSEKINLGVKNLSLYLMHSSRERWQKIFQHDGG